MYEMIVFVLVKAVSLMPSHACLKGKKYYQENQLRSEETYSHVFIGIKYAKETFYQNEFDFYY